MATNKPRIPVTMEPELFEEVTAFRRAHGISSQSKAIQYLVRIGLDSLSGDLSPEDSASQERELLDIARKLDPAQKAFLLRVLHLAGERAETRQTP